MPHLHHSSVQHIDCARESHRKCSNLVLLLAMRRTQSARQGVEGCDLGVVHCLAEDAGAEGGDVEDGAQGHAPAVLKTCDTLEGHLLRDDVYVREAPLLLRGSSAAASASSTA